jgi:cytochrome c
LVAKGRELFNAKEGLGVKFACIMCHKDAKAVKKAKVDEFGEQLPDVINKYIVTKAKGTEIAKDSPEMQALVAYIKFEHSK